MKKIAVFGNAGGGKSTLSQKLSEIIGLPLHVVFGIDSLAERLRQRFRKYYPKQSSVMRKIEWSNYIAQSLICAGVLTILILRGYANGIATLSVPQNHSSTDEIERRSIAKNPQQLCSNIPMAKPVTRTELFFGLRKPNGAEVNQAEFQQFLDREVTPRFPDGFTRVCAPISTSYAARIDRTNSKSTDRFCSNFVNLSRKISPCLLPKTKQSSAAFTKKFSINVTSMRSMN